MKKILLFLLSVSMTICVSAQRLRHIIDMDKLAESNGLLLSSAVPNPCNGTTDMYLVVLENTEVTMMIADMSGRVEAMYNNTFETGVHQFRITLTNSGTHFIGAFQDGNRSSGMIICNNGGGYNHIEYIGLVEAVEKAALYRMINKDKEEAFEGYSIIESAKQLPEQEPFRVALSISPFTLKQFKEGYTLNIGDQTATNAKELQQIYNDLGSTEMFVRIATKRHVTADDTTDGQPDENANVHTFDQAMEICRIAAELNTPVNPEIMCAYTYMDMDKIQAPRFEEYPEIYALQHGKRWEDMNLEEICIVLEAYGELVADSILSIPNITVNNWNIGNEANYGFAGVGVGYPTAVDPKLGSVSTLKKYMASVFSLRWLKQHVWRYEAQTLAAVKRGVLKAYAKHPEHPTDNVKFSTHIATVVFTARCSAAFFQCMRDNGYDMQTAGLSYYPSAPSLSMDRKKILTKTVTRINKKCGLPVFIAEFSYPSGNMEGPFAGWNKVLGEYEKNEQGQAAIYSDVISWGKYHGMAGIRYWAPDYKGWSAMSMFNFTEENDGKNTGTAKPILVNHSDIINK